jgi:hypothetical protein
MFANHQTFHPRFGWIKKGYDAAVADPNVFNLKSAPVRLGVGKNMVEAIRFWAMATKVTTRRPHPERPRLSVHTPTHVGRALLDDRLGLVQRFYRDRYSAIGSLLSTVDPFVMARASGDNKYCTPHQSRPIRPGRAPDRPLPYLASSRGPQAVSRHAATDTRRRTATSIRRLHRPLGVGRRGRASTSAAINAA